MEAIFSWSNLLGMMPDLKRLKFACIALLVFYPALGNTFKFWSTCKLFSPYPNKQRCSCLWYGWWHHWSLSQQHMGTGHAWERTNAPLRGPCASPQLTKSMGNLEQENGYSLRWGTIQKCQTKTGEKLKMFLHYIPDVVSVPVCWKIWMGFA